MVIKQTLDRYILARVIPAFIAAVVFFCLLLELIDLFTNLVKYIQNDASLSQIFHIMLMYLPHCVSLSLAPALLFASAYSFGSLGNSNELIVIHGSGVSLTSFAVPVILFAGIISITGFIFEDRVALPFLREKNSTARILLGQKITVNNAEIVLLNKKAGIVWTADYFNDTEKSLSGVTVIRRNTDGTFIERIDARSAVWTKDRWTFKDARRWYFIKDEMPTESFESAWVSNDYSEPPSSFRKGKKDLDELTVSEALDYVNFLKSAGLPYQGGMAEYYERFTFGLTPLIVTLLSVGVGGRLRKNVILSSLLISLAAATGYYVIRMISLLFARLDIVSPFMGAMAPLVIFFAIGALLFRTAHT